jgi:antitoxin ParD1/3/4
MPSVHKVSIALTGDQIEALKAVVDAGEYATTSEVIREAIRDWRFKRELRQEEIRQLRRLWDEGKAGAKSEPVNFTKLKTEARRRLAGTPKKGAGGR